MREIKFRALDAATCEWVYYGTAITGTVDYLQLRKDTESQYTGIKDKNGIEIYEGDIYSQGDNKILYVVVWRDCGLVGRQIRNQSTAGIGYWASAIDVIGNIYENPELLEC